MSRSKTAGGKSLVIVESPSKAKTIGKFLGSKYKVLASVGHIRDLPKSKLGIDLENNFEPQYIAIRGKGDLIKELRKEAKKADKVFLATDPDREGEAISWHIAHLLGMDLESESRIVFNEITKTAIKAAIKSPRKIDSKLVDAQQARRVLDRLVGYQISPLLWRKIKPGLSAGRVQSATLKMICEKENTIRSFVPEEFWTLEVKLESLEAEAESSPKDRRFLARLASRDGKKFVPANEFEAEEVEKDLKNNDYIVRTVDRKERRKNPYAPFTTSSLQQDAANKLGFSTKKTMMVAQQLYEGVEVKGYGTVGLVTYIRTDSVRISEEARALAKSFILEKFGTEYYGGAVFSNKKKDVQDAHEAIRPSHIEILPENIREYVSKDQYNLYKLIWNRFIASQMAAAVYDAISVQIENGRYGFKATGSKIKFDGYLRIYKSSGEDDDSRMLPHMEENRPLKYHSLKKEQNFTQPPARYTEASLVKDLEEKNIGRPSTYAPIIATLIDRKYISREKKSLLPTELGYIVTELMERYFKEIVDVGFTAELEDKLDGIEVDDLNWKKIVGDFYEIFAEELKIADEEIEKVKIEDELIGENCEICGRPLAKKSGRFGDFIACTGYPECKNTRPIVQKIDVACPSCGKDLIVRKGKRGRVFYGCSGYPECSQVFWERPTGEKCPQCGSLLLEKKAKDSSMVCSNGTCGYKK